jgi:predicted O-methyltransferase YrrM
LIAAALQRHPDMAGILFDLDHVIERARSNLQQAGVEHRCQLVAGSFFESVPEGADAYLMRHIIHDWSDEESVKILHNCRERVSDNGRVLIVEAIVPEGNDPSPAKEMDMAMLLYPGGMERTETEYQTLLHSAGFELAGVTPTTSMVSVLEGRPAA